MKINEVEITKVTYSDLEQSTLFQECRDMAPKLNRQWRTLNEGKALNTGEIHDLFTGVEQTMTSGNINKTLIGKGADAFGDLGTKIDSVKQALKDTTPVQGLDAAFADLKQTAAGKLEKTPGGSAVLRTIDRYQQFAKKYPKTQKALWNSAAIIGGLLSGGAAVPLILGTAKTLDSMVLGNELSTSIGAGVGSHICLMKNYEPLIKGMFYLLVLDHIVILLFCPEGLYLNKGGVTSQIYWCWYISSL
jgi:hypothetical protein